MKNLKFTGRAEQDLADIVDYNVRHWGKAQAQQYLSDIQDHLNLLCINPELGRLRNELQIGLRCLPVESHHVFYLQQRDSLIVVRVLHKSRDAELHLSK